VDVNRKNCQPHELILTNIRLTLANRAELQVSHFPYPNANPQLTIAEAEFDRPPLDAGRVSGGIRAAYGAG
jgi:hypothetical protein